MLAMMVERSYPALAATVEAGALGQPTGRQLAGRTLLIIGLGASGRQLARRAVAFGMRVIAIQRRGPGSGPRRRATACAGSAGSTSSTGRSARPTSCRFHLPFSQETRHLLDARRLALIRPGGVVVNVSRGGLIDEVALAEAVRSGHLFGAGLDVVEGEPAGPDHPLRGIPQVILTPHVAGAIDATARRRARFAAMNLSRLRYGLEPLCRIDPSAAGLTVRRRDATRWRTRYGPTRQSKPRATNVVESAPSIRAGPASDVAGPKGLPRTWTGTSARPTSAST